MPVLVQQVLNHGNVGFHQCLKIFSPEHLVSDLQNHFRFARSQILFQGVFAKRSTPPSDQCHRGVRSQLWAQRLPSALMCQEHTPLARRSSTSHPGHACEEPKVLCPRNACEGIRGHALRGEALGQARRHLQVVSSIALSGHCARSEDRLEDILPSAVLIRLLVQILPKSKLLRHVALLGQGS